MPPRQHQFPGRPPGQVQAPKRDETPPWNIAYPEDALISVEGQVFVAGYEREKGQDLALLEQICSRLGLAYIVMSAEWGDVPRKKWARNRTFLDVAIADVADRPGITFLQWAHRNYLPPAQQQTVPPDPKNPIFKPALARAQVALHRLYQAGRVVKRYDDEGQLILYTPSAAPPKRKLLK